MGQPKSPQSGEAVPELVSHSVRTSLAQDHHASSLKILIHDLGLCGPLLGSEPMSGEMPMTTTDAPPPSSPPAEDFFAFRRGFLLQYADAFLTSAAYVLENAKLISVSALAEAPATAFTQEMMRSGTNATTFPAWHGTSKFRMLSIFARGLLIAADGTNDVTIANGRTYGDGVYAADISAPWLACDFIRDFEEDVVKIFACAVLGDDLHVTQHHDSWVITKHTRIIPLAIVYGARRIPQPPRVRLELEAAAPVMAIELYRAGLLLSEDVTPLAEIRMPPTFGWCIYADIEARVRPSRALLLWAKLPRLLTVSYTDRGPMVQLSK